MAGDIDGMTDEAGGILEMAIKSKPKDTKARTDLHKKANGELKDLQKYINGQTAEYNTRIDETTRTLEEAFGVASSEAGLRDREIVRHLRQAIKLSKGIDRPDGWAADAARLGRLPRGARGACHHQPAPGRGAEPCLRG